MRNIFQAVHRISPELSLFRPSPIPGHACRGTVPGSRAPSHRPPRPLSGTSCLLVERGCFNTKMILAQFKDNRKRPVACHCPYGLFSVRQREGCQGELVCHDGAHISSKVMDLASTLSFETAAHGLASTCPFAFLPFSQEPGAGPRSEALSQTFGIERWRDACGPGRSSRRCKYWPEWAVALSGV